MNFNLLATLNDGIQIWKECWSKKRSVLCCRWWKSTWPACPTCAAYHVNEETGFLGGCDRRYSLKWTQRSEWLIGPKQLTKLRQQVTYQRTYAVDGRKNRNALVLSKVQINLKLGVFFFSIIRFYQISICALLMAAFVEPWMQHHILMDVAIETF